MRSIFPLFPFILFLGTTSDSPGQEPPPFREFSFAVRPERKKGETPAGKAYHVELNLIGTNRRNAFNWPIKTVLHDGETLTSEGMNLVPAGEKTVLVIALGDNESNFAVSSGGDIPEAWPAKVSAVFSYAVRIRELPSGRLRVDCTMDTAQVDSNRRWVPKKGSLQGFSEGLVLGQKRTIDLGKDKVSNQQYALEVTIQVAENEN